MSYEPYDDIFLKHWKFNRSGWGSTLAKSFTEYHDLPALLIEKAYAVGRSLMAVISSYEYTLTDFWILGNSYYVTNISAKQGIECGDYSCYDKSSREGKICQQGTFLYN